MKEAELEEYTERLQQIFLLTMRRISKQTTDCEPKLTGPQFYILQLLRNEGRSTVSSLAEDMSVKPSAITAMIDRLLKQEYVSRERDEQDRRVVFIQIAEEGKKVLEETLQKRKSILVKYLSHLEREEIESLISIYEKLSRLDIKE
ncbi:MarR family winged helix-turn-helix transcriptional regulator [Shimazuella kribbensis]|uniref:MarR family winged helix-turn-helix transcriptional regulator n=1 Tax=Shimazuella kribbensis TaxID=139808 RepID=UPI00048B82F2|nr:MarR family transcriptional regulator [Shimazuella kribbensis]